MEKFFSPGCTLMLYKPDLAQRVYTYMRRHIPDLQFNTACCNHRQPVEAPALYVSVCSGCINNFAKQDAGYDSRSVWETIDQDPDFPYPDYGGLAVSIQDACPTRDRPHVHQAIRRLLARMNLSLVEPPNTREKTKCCGDIFWLHAGKAEALAREQERADEMPCQHVVVHCVSCIKAFHNGGKTPLYLTDLLFGEPTADYGPVDPDEWHTKQNAYIDSHRP